uniref:Glycosyl hydrolase family 13 catalytic domain-containing protein n=1 Tax=Timema poppense TaxID=170557 RepID=A0A7R9HC12_TIMPO|nr:unnamed protein product [Timema poppensis]
MLLMVLPGVAVTYNGEEIGMEDTFISWEQTKDPNGLYVGSRRYTKFSRDPQRTPFQWDTSTSAGFSRNTSTWLPVNDNYMKLNLKSQKLTKESHYHVYKRLVQARRSAPLQRGDLDIQVVSKYVLTIFRLLEGHETFVAIINFGDNEEKINITEITKIAGEPGHIQVQIGSVHSGFSQGAKISPGILTLHPYAAVLIVVPGVKSEKRERQHDEVEDQAEQIEKMVFPELDIDNESMEGDLLDLTEEDEALNSTLISTDTLYNAKTSPDSGDLATDTSEALFSTTDANDETVTDNEELDTTAMFSQDDSDEPVTTLKTTRTTKSTDVGKSSTTSKSPSSAYSGISLILNVTSSVQVDSNRFNTLNAISKSDESSSESVEATDEGSNVSVSIPDMSSNANESEELSDIIEDFNGGGVVAEAMTTSNEHGRWEKTVLYYFVCLFSFVGE